MIRDGVYEVNVSMMSQEVVDNIDYELADVTILTAGEFSAAKVSEFDAIAFGCPAMGAEVLEETEFEPMFESVESSLGGKKIGIFGSYGWGDGQWMRDWVDRMTAAGATVVGGEGVICQEAPDGAAEEACKELGRALAAI